ncbi:MAG: lamin tail domain-containing protein, partial [bacterium]|nr:lamin tail domain-containing protein [bacterium]
MRALFVAVTVAFIPSAAVASVSISEVMYDAEGTDTDREWVELYNSGSESMDITGWKINDGSNHVLNVPPKNGSKGSMVIATGGHLILAA